MGMGSSRTSVLDAWARPSPSCTVRAVITTSKPRRANADGGAAADAPAGAGHEGDPA